MRLKAHIQSNARVQANCMVEPESCELQSRGGGGWDFPGSYNFLTLESFVAIYVVSKLLVFIV